LTTTDPTVLAALQKTQTDITEAQESVANASSQLAQAQMDLGVLASEIPPPAVVPPPPVTTPTWQADYSTGDFTQWDNWSQSDAGPFSVTTPAAAGIPAPPSGEKNVAVFQVVSANDPQSKLYKNWNIGKGNNNSETGKPLTLLTNRGSGTYTAWYYLPTNYADTFAGPVNIFQFKESFSTNGQNLNGNDTVDWGSDMQDSMNLWDLAGIKGFDASYAVVGPAPTGNQPYLGVGLWHNPVAKPTHAFQVCAAPLGKWFAVQAKLVAGDHVTYAILDSSGGTIMTDTWTNAEYPCGVRANNVVPAYPGQAGGTTCMWSFGVGHYGSNVGELWSAAASYVAA
jgi:hypothetical protein